MMRGIALAAWVCLVLAGTGYGVLSSGFLSRNEPTAPAQEKLETMRINQISVPSLRDGSVSGYFVIRLNAIVAASGAKRASIKIDDLITDEAFKTIYAAAAELSTGRKSDLEKLMTSIVERVNHRLDDKIVRALQIQEFTYVDRKDVRK